MTTEHPRVQALAERFRAIGDTMRDLPIYNVAVEVEAFGFAPQGPDLVGVLITPWFMNLILLPEEPVSEKLHQMGDKVQAELPAGPFVTRWGGDKEIGGFRCISLHSPMGVFLSQPQARAEAQLQLERFLTPPEPEVAEAEETPRTGGIDRRAFFRGKLRA